MRGSRAACKHARLFVSSARSLALFQAQLNRLSEGAGGGARSKLSWHHATSPRNPCLDPGVPLKHAVASEQSRAGAATKASAADRRTLNCAHLFGPFFSL